MTTRPYRVRDTKTETNWIVVCDSALKAKRYLAEQVMMELEAAALSALEVLTLVHNGTTVIHVQRQTQQIEDEPLLPPFPAEVLKLDRREAA